ncbi:MAG: hypothetical protein CME68_03000 [Halobacteriovoraceae bacterium]|nr:hypothetical protein [Halobacteriovoraceae bacterium]
MPFILSIAEFFLLSMAFGISLFTLIAKSELTGGGFLRLVHNVSISSLLLGFICHIYRVPFGDVVSWIYVFSSLCLILSSVFHKDEKTTLMWLLYIIQNIALGAGLYTYQSHLFTDGNFHFMNVAFFFSSALFLGVITYSMLLGHWYLVVPKLSEKPLKIALSVTWLVMLVKLVMTLGALVKDASFFLEGSRLGAGYMFNWIILTMRMVWGYLIIGIMSYFTWRLVKMRSIQSATGVLYVMTFFVFVGELISAYLFHKYGMYL